VICHTSSAQVFPSKEVSSLDVPDVIRAVSF
jgi:hypothetical protein